uniref:F-box domain-containing protein n=1 Tax=Mycena chlorophos TaxID=658473 RepID=A0ABQ0LM24_MYCCL|nr:predicted protein [Mycena chlorophos]
MTKEANVAAASLVSLPAELKNQIFVNLSLPDLLILAGPPSRHLTVCCEALIYRSPTLSTSVQLVRFYETIVHRGQLACLFVNVPYTPVLFKKHAELLVRAAPCLQNLRRLLA